MLPTQPTHCRGALLPPRSLVPCRSVLLRTSRLPLPTPPLPLSFCQLETVGAKLLVGADGNQSGVRQQLFGDGPPSFMGTVIWRGGG